MNNPRNQPCPYNTLRGCVIGEHTGAVCPFTNVIYTEPAKPLTNGDRIRAMTDEELAYWMTHLHEGGNMSLIDAAPMLEQLDLEHYDKDWYVSQYNADWIYSWLDSQPVIEAEPVKHGRWVDLPVPVAVYGCSLCKTEIPFGKFPDEMKFCHNCGAKMDLEET